MNFKTLIITFLLVLSSTNAQAEIGNDPADDALILSFTSVATSILVGPGLTMSGGGVAVVSATLGVEAGALAAATTALAVTIYIVNTDPQRHLDELKLDAEEYLIEGHKSYQFKNFLEKFHANADRVFTTEQVASVLMLVDRIEFNN